MGRGRPGGTIAEAIRGNEGEAEEAFAALTVRQKVIMLRNVLIFLYNTTGGKEKWATRVQVNAAVGLARLLMGQKGVKLTPEGGVEVLEWGKGIKETLRTIELGLASSPITPVGTGSRDRVVEVVHQDGVKVVPAEG